MVHLRWISQLTSLWWFLQWICVLLQLTLENAVQQGAAANEKYFLWKIKSGGLNKMTWPVLSATNNDDWLNGCKAGNFIILCNLTTRSTYCSPFWSGCLLVRSAKHSWVVLMIRMLCVWLLLTLGGAVGAVCWSGKKIGVWKRNQVSVRKSCCTRMTAL